MTRTALIVVDMLTDFFIAKPGLPVPARMAPLVANTQRACRTILRERDIKTCVVTGTWTNACVQHTAMGAWCGGYDVIVLTDCCSCPDEKEHERALAYMKQFYGTEAIDSATWFARLDAALPGSGDDQTRYAVPVPSRSTVDAASGTVFDGQPSIRVAAPQRLPHWLKCSCTPSRTRAFPQNSSGLRRNGRSLQSFYLR